MKAITIATGEAWTALAEQTAVLAERATGLEVQILDRSAVNRAGVASAPFLKFHLFDLVEAENLLFFDADLAFVRRWDPTVYAGRPEIVCVRDHWRAGWIISDANLFDIPPFEYFNTGLFVVNRRHHERWLRFAKQCLFETPSSLKEQGALNAARIRLGIPAHFLSRRYNTVGTVDAPLWDTVQAVALHDAGGNRLQLNEIVRRTLLEKELPQAPDEDPDFTGGYFWYQKSERKRRLVQLLPDGTLEGGEDERLWFLTEFGALLLTTRSRVICELVKSNERWEGRTGDPTLSQTAVLEAVAGEKLATLLSSLGAVHAGMVFGWNMGFTSRVLLERLESLHLYLIAEGDTALKREDVKEDFSEMTRPFACRRFIIDSINLRDALSVIANDSLEFLFLSSAGLDENHPLEVILAKLAPGAAVIVDLDMSQAEMFLRRVRHLLAPSENPTHKARGFACFRTLPVTSIGTEKACAGYNGVVREKTRTDGYCREFNCDEKEVCRQIIEQRRFQYVRIGYDSRRLELLENGRIGQGKAACEEGWYIHEDSAGNLGLIVFGRGQRTCRLLLENDGVWRGQWRIGERMSVELRPLR